MRITQWFLNWAEGKTFDQELKSRRKHKHTRQYKSVNTQLNGRKLPQKKTPFFSASDTFMLSSKINNDSLSEMSTPRSSPMQLRFYDDEDMTTIVRRWVKAKSQVKIFFTTNKLTPATYGFIDAVLRESAMTKFPTKSASAKSTVYTDKSTDTVFRISQSFADSIDWSKEGTRKPFILPQMEVEPGRITVHYGRVTRALVRMMTEEEASLMLGGKKVSSHVRRLLGKDLSFEGAGDNLDADRVYVRDQLGSVTSCWGPFISEIHIFLPVAFLDYNDATLTVSGSKANMKNKHSLSDARLLVLATDLQNPEDTLNAFLHKNRAENNIKRVIVLNTSTYSTNKVNADIKTLLSKCGATEDVTLNAETLDPTHNGASTLADAFHNLALFTCTAELEDFSDSWMKRLTENSIGTRIPDSFPSSGSSLSSSSASSVGFSASNQGESLQLSLSSSSSSMSSISSSSPTTSSISQNSMQFVLPGSEDACTESFSPAHNLSFVLKMNQLSESFNSTLHISETESPTAKRSMNFTKEDDDEDEEDEEDEEDALVTVTADQILERFRKKAKDIKDSLCTTPLELHGESAAALGMVSFGDAIRASRRQAELSWPQFRQSFLATREACRYILNPRYEGECLGSDLKKFFCEPLINFSIRVWEKTITDAFHNAESKYVHLTNDILELCRKALDVPSLGDHERLQMRQLVWQCQEGAEQIIFTHFQQIYARLALKNMRENYESTVRAICKQVIKMTLLSQVRPALTLKEFHDLVIQGITLVPEKCASAISLLFTSTIAGAANAKLNAIEAEVFRLIKSVLLVSSASQRSWSGPSLSHNTYGLTHRQLEKAFSILSGSSTDLNEELTSAKIEAYKELLKKDGLSEAQTENTESGDSQFCSLARLSYGTEEACTVARLLAVGELLRNPHEFYTLFPSFGALHAYARRMSEEGVPGDHISLLAFSTYACVDIAVYTPYSQDPLRLRGLRRNRPGAEHFANAMRQAASASTGGTLVMRIALPRPGEYTPLVPARTAELEETSQPQTYKRSYSKRNRTKHRPEQCKSLADICLAKLADQAALFPALTPQTLGEELTARLLKKIIEDKKCESVDFDLVLQRLVQPSFEALDLANCIYFSEYTLATISCRCPRLAVLSLSGCSHVQDSRIEAIAENCHGLTELNIQRCIQVGDAGLYALAENCPSLTSLDISYCPRVTSAGVDALHNLPLKTLATVGCYELNDAAFREFMNLEALNAAQCQNITDETLGNLSAHCACSLRSLAISSRYVTDTGIAYLIRSCPSLEALNLTGCSRVARETLTAAFTSKCALQKFVAPITEQGVGDDSFPFSAIAAISAPFSTTNLEFLNIAGSDITDRTLVHIASFCPQLSSLVVAGCAHITDAGLRILYSKLPLVLLDASRCPLVTDGSVRALAESSGEYLTCVMLNSVPGITDFTLMALAEHCPKIKTLDISHNERITNTGIAQIAAACPCLEFIALEDCKGLDDGALRPIAGSPCRTSLRVLKASCIPGLTDAGVSLLGNFPSLEYCDISYCPNTTLQCISAILQSTPRLHTLEIRGGIKVTRDLPGDLSLDETVHRSLRSINLSWIRDESVNAVLEVFARACKYLEVVNLSRSQFLTDASVRKLAEQCPNLRQINLSECRKVQESTIKFLVLSGISVLR